MVEEGRLGDVAQSRRYARSSALPPKDQEGFREKKAIALMVARPSMIKRPVLDVGGKLLVGFKPEQYEKAFGKGR